MQFYNTNLITIYINVWRLDSDHGKVGWIPICKGIKFAGRTGIKIQNEKKYKVFQGEIAHFSCLLAVLQDYILLPETIIQNMEHPMLQLLYWRRSRLNSFKPWSDWLFYRWLDSFTLTVCSPLHFYFWKQSNEFSQYILSRLLNTMRCSFPSMHFNGNQPTSGAFHCWA